MSARFAAQDKVCFAQIRAEAERLRQQRDLAKRDMCWRAAERLIDRVNRCWMYRWSRPHGTTASFVSLR